MSTTTEAWCKKWNQCKSCNFSRIFLSHLYLGIEKTWWHNSIQVQTTIVNFFFMINLQMVSSIVTFIYHYQIQDSDWSVFDAYLHSMYPVSKMCVALLKSEGFERRSQKCAQMQIDLSLEVGGCLRRGDLDWLLEKSCKLTLLCWKRQKKKQLLL